MNDAPIKMNLTHVLDDFDKTEYIFPAIYCANKCIESQAYFAYLTTYVALLLGDTNVTLNQTLTNDQIQHWFAHPSGLFDVNAITFVLCLETIKEGLTDAFASIYLQDLFTNVKTSAFLLVWACRYARLSICEAIINVCPDVVIQSRTPVTFVTGQFPTKGTYTLMPNTYGQYTPHQALSLCRGDDLAITAVKYLLERHGIFDASALDDLSVSCRYGEWAYLGANEAKVLPTLKLASINGRVDLSHMISAASVIVIQDFLKSVSEDHVWQYEALITYSATLEMKAFLKAFGADLPAQKVTELEGAIQWMMDKRLLLGLSPNNNKDVMETRLVNVNKALCLQYSNDMPSQLADMFLTRRFLPDQQFVETTILRLLSTDESIHSILTTCQAFQTPVVIRSMLCLTATAELKHIWDVSSAMESLLSFADPSNGRCKPDVRTCILGYVLHWLTLRFYDAHPIHELLIAPLKQWTGPLPPLSSDLACETKAVIPSSFVNMYSKLGDAEWAEVIGYLERLDANPWRESILACVFDKVHPESGNNILQTLLKMEFTQSASAVLAWSSRMSTQSNPVRQSLLTRENLLGERALHLIAAQTNIEVMPVTLFNEVMIDTIMSIGIGRGALCGQSTKRGNLLHYAALSGDSAKIRLVLADMDVTLRDSLWDGDMTYEALAVSRSELDTSLAVTRVLRTFTLQQEEWLDFDETVYDSASDDDSLAAEDDITPNQSDEEAIDE